MRILLMHNPKAGDRKHRKKQLIALLAKFGHQTIYQSTNKRGCRKALKKSVDIVIAAGGDGTVSKVARRLIGTGIPLGVLPLGTANNLADTLGFTASPEEIVACLNYGKKQTFDTCLAKGSWGKRYFLEAAGGGLLADYIQAMKGKKSKTSYERKTIWDVSRLRQILIDYRARRWKIDIDGEDISGRYLLWEAMNIPRVGPELDLAPRAATDDGRLDFVGVRERERSLFMEHLNARLAGRKSKFPLPVRRFRKLKVTSPVIGLHLDGKSWPRKKPKLKRGDAIEIRVHPAALVIWQPASPR